MKGHRTVVLATTLAMLAALSPAPLAPDPSRSPPPPDPEPDDAQAFARRLDPSRDERPRPRRQSASGIYRGCPDRCGLDCPSHGPMARKLARRAARAQNAR